MSKEAMKLALEGAANYIDALGGDSRKYRQALANEALDKMAENARELGLDYEPAQEKDQSVMYTYPSKPEPIPCGKPMGILMKQKGDEHMKLYPLTEQPAQQEPVAFYIYKPVLPRGSLGNVSDGDLPWVYDQDPSSGFAARMLVAPVTSPPAQRKPLTKTKVGNYLRRHAHGEVGMYRNGFKDGVAFAEAAHGIKENT